MNQQQFAEFIGVQKGTVSKWADRGRVLVADDGSVSVAESLAKLARYRRTGMSGLAPARLPKIDPEVEQQLDAAFNDGALEDYPDAELDALCRLYGVKLPPNVSPSEHEATSSGSLQFAVSGVSSALLDSAIRAEKLGHRPWG